MSVLILINHIISQLEQQLLYSEFQRKVFSIMTRLNTENVIDPNLRKQLKFLSMPGPAALPQDQLSRVRRTVAIVGSLKDYFFDKTRIYVLTMRDVLYEGL